MSKNLKRPGGWKKPLALLIAITSLSALIIPPSVIAIIKYSSGGNDTAPSTSDPNSNSAITLANTSIPVPSELSKICALNLEKGESNTDINILNKWIVDNQTTLFNNIDKPLTTSDIDAYVASNSDIVYNGNFLCSVNITINIGTNSFKLTVTGWDNCTTIYPNAILTANNLGLTNTTPNTVCKQDIVNALNSHISLFTTCAPVGLSITSISNLVHNDNNVTFTANVTHYQFNANQIANDIWVNDDFKITW